MPGLLDGYRAFNAALASLYREDLLTLADKKPPFEFDGGVFDKAAQAIYDNKGFDMPMMATPEARAVVEETMRVLETAIGSGLPHEVPETLRYALENNAFIFSGFKSFHALREVGLSLVTEKGDIKPFADFLNDVRKINDKYNRNYLYAEYNHAVGASQMAAKWHDIEQDGDRYDLQYRTAGDNKVREEHALLHGITLPPSDPFWDSYFPPNGWNCRCTAVQVRRNKYPRSNSEDAIKRGEECTAGAKKAIFRYNPGKSLELFPPKHPYYKVPKKAKAAIKKMTEEEIKAKRIADLRTQLPDTLTDAEKDAKAQNNYDIEQALKITCGKPMSVDEADKQNANPNHVAQFIPDPNGTYRDKAGHKFRKNKDYDRKRDEPFSINCQTCTPAYALRLLGFNITAKGNTSGSKLDFLSRGGNAWKIWKNPDGTQAEHTKVNDWLAKKKYKQMTEKRWLEFFDETCKEEGVYALSIGWGGRSGHMTVLQRFKDGTLKYIEPQQDNSEGSGREWDDIKALAKAGGKTQHDCRGIMRIDNKLFDTSYLDIFDTI